MIIIRNIIIDVSCIKKSYEKVKEVLMEFSLGLGNKGQKFTLFYSSPSNPGPVKRLPSSPFLRYIKGLE